MAAVANWMAGMYITDLGALYETPELPNTDRSSYIACFNLMLSTKQLRHYPNQKGIQSNQ
jgi:hypothetical protein